MIFEADTRKVKETVSILQSLYTASEWAKKETSWVELKVEQERVTITSNGLKPFPFQVTLEEAEPILEGRVRVNIRDFYNVLKTYEKDSETLLFERDAGELRIDDGVYPAEIILLNEENELEDGFSLSKPQSGEGFEIPVGPLNEALALARQLIRSTFLPATGMVGLGKERDGLLIRGFNLTEMYEAKIPLSESVVSGWCLLSKADASRLGKFIDRIKHEETIQLAWRDGWLYVQHGSFLLAFPAPSDPESETIFQILPFHGMKETEKAADIGLNRLKKLVSVPKGKELDAVGFVWRGSMFERVPEEGVAELAVPCKTLQRIVSKWPHDRLRVKKGVAENGSPLILESEMDGIRHLYILMPLESVTDEASSVNRTEAKTA
jgi:hypothetical protein